MGIKLSGEDARNFAYALYHPDIDEIRKRDKRLNLDNIHITKVENGFIVEIPELDLSFVKEITNVN